MSLQSIIQPPFRLLVVGPSETGKSSTIRYIAGYLYKNCFNRIYCLSNNARNNPNYNYAHDRVSGDEQQLTEIITNILDYNKSLLESQKSMPAILLVLEDYQCVFSGRNPKIINRLSAEARNYNISVIWSVHQLSTVSTMVRNNCSHFICTGHIGQSQIPYMLEPKDLTQTQLKLLNKRNPYEVAIIKHGTNKFFILPVPSAFKTVALSSLYR